MKYSLLIALLALVFGANAQHEWVYSMQSFNLYDGIGAAAGMYERSAINARYRHQWVGVEGAPQTALISYQTRLNGRLGFGVRAMAETLGAFDRTATVAHISWRSGLGKGELAFALGGGVLYEKMSRDRIAALHADDPALTGAPDQVAPLVNASALYRSERWFAGVEAQHLLPRESTWGELTTTGKVAELTLFTGSTHALNDDWSVRPMAALRYSTSRQLLPELQAGMWYRQNLWFGLGYRHAAAAYAFTEYRIRNKYRLAYNFGWPLMQYTVAPATAGNHELMLGIFWGKSERRTLQSIRYFQ
jgi:type IX secretion system PorP/SprF family membrane protein